MTFDFLNPTPMKPLKTHCPNSFFTRHRFLTVAFLCASIFSFAQKDSADVYLKKGLQEKANGRLLESFKNFDKADKYDPNNIVIVTHLASTYVELRKYPQAKEKYQQLEKLGDVSPSTYKQLTQLSFNMRQYDDVVKYAGSLKQADKNEKVNYFIGKAHYERDNYGDAIQFLTAAAKEEPTNAEIPYMIAHSYADMMNYKLSIPFFEKAIALDTTKNNWYYELGLVCYAIRDDKNSLKYMLLAGQRGYLRSNDYLENLGIAYLNVGKLQEGLNIMLETLKRRPSDISVLNMIAEAYYDNGKYTEAMGYWDQVLGYDKTNASALYMIGMCYMKKGEKEKGIALCDKAIQMDPSLQSLKKKKEMPNM